MLALYLYASATIAVAWGLWHFLDVEPGPARDPWWWSVVAGVVVGVLWPAVLFVGAALAVLPVVVDLLGRRR